MPDVIPQVEQFISILRDIKLDWLFTNDPKMNPKVEIDYVSSHIEY